MNVKDTISNHRMHADIIRQHKVEQYALLEDAMRQKLTFVLCKGNMHPTEVQIIAVHSPISVDIKRQDNGKQYTVSPFFLYSDRNLVDC